MNLDINNNKKLSGVIIMWYSKVCKGKKWFIYKPVRVSPCRDVAMAATSRRQPTLDDRARVGSDEHEEAAILFLFPAPGLSQIGHGLVRR